MIAMINHTANRRVPTMVSAESSASLPSLKNVSSVKPKSAQNIVFKEIQKLQEKAHNTVGRLINLPCLTGRHGKALLYFAVFQDCTV